jgi:hypothetical protein
MKNPRAAARTGRGPREKSAVLGGPPHRPAPGPGGCSAAALRSKKYPKQWQMPTITIDNTPEGDIDLDDYHNQLGNYRFDKVVFQGEIQPSEYAMKIGFYHASHVVEFETKDHAKHAKTTHNGQWVYDGERTYNYTTE